MGRDLEPFAAVADLRIPSSLPAATPAPARTSDAVRAAQRAFFDTALGSTGAPAPRGAAAAAAPAISTAVAVSRPSPQLTASIPDTPPARPLRPGSLLDIRI